MSYFVFGLPRSRTAWLSVFLSQSGRFCHHEAVNGCYTEDEYIKKINGCGDSTTAFNLCPTIVYKDRPTVIIEKSKAEFNRCVEWCDAVFQTNSRQVLTDMYDDLMAIEGMRILQSQINENLPVIFEYLTNKKWNASYQDVKNINIQSDIRTLNIDSIKAYSYAQL